MFAAEVFARSPSRASSSGMRWSSVSPSGKFARIRPAREMSAVSISTPEPFMKARTMGRRAWVARAGASSILVQVIVAEDMVFRWGRGGRLAFEAERLVAMGPPAALEREGFVTFRGHSSPAEAAGPDPLRGGPNVLPGEVAGEVPGEVAGVSSSAAGTPGEASPVGPAGDLVEARGPVGA